MLAERTISAFIDIDNCGLELVNYHNILAQLADFGEVVAVKLYGASEKKNRDIVLDATNCGYDMELPMRVKKRGVKVFDNRIAIDVVSCVLENPNIDAVAVICAPSDMVYLYRKLKAIGVAVIALDNADEYTMALVSEIVDSGIVDVIKPKRPNPFVKKTEPKEKVVESVKPIEHISKKVEIPVEEKPVQVSKPVLEKVREQQVKPLFEEIKPIAQSAPIVDAPKKVEVKPVVVEPIKVEKKEIVPEEEVEVSPKTVKPTSSVNYVPQDDLSIIRQIEELKSGSGQSDDNAELLEEIKKLLDEFKAN